MMRNWTRHVSMVAIVAAVGVGCSPAEGETWNIETADWWEQAKLTAPVPTKNQHFGDSVCVDGQTAIIGVPKYQGGGAAYIFEYAGGSWAQTDLLTASDRANFDNFGGAVSISGDVAVIGATGSNEKAGSAYVFEKTISGWSQVARLLPGHDGTPYDYFGCSVSVSGTTAIVGAKYEDGNGNDAGAAYIYNKTYLGWMKAAKIIPDDTDRVGHFGASVALDGIVAVIGAPANESWTGAAYVFQNAGASWTQGAKLTADDAAVSDHFGESVSISGLTAVVGAPSDDDYGGSSGSAYIFENAGLGWTQADKLTPDDARATDHFGTSVSMSDGLVVVGAWGEPVSRGSAYIFENTDPGWTQEGKVLPGDGILARGFGESVSVSGATIFVAAGDDKHIVDGAGAVYVYVPEPATLSLLALGGMALIRRRKRRACK